MQLGPVLFGEVEMRQYVGLAVIDECGELRPFLPQLISHVTQRLAGLRPVRLDERLAHRRRHHALLGLRHIGQRVAHPMHATALPGGVEHPPDRCLKPSWASEITSFTPRSPRRARLLRKLDQNVSASEGPLIPDSPIACTSSSTRRVDTPIQASWITPISAFSDTFRASRNGGK